MAQPWHCTWCKKDIKGTFSNCGFCGAHWTECRPQTPRARKPQSPRRVQNTAWTYAGQWHGYENEYIHQGPWAGHGGTKSPKRPTKKSPARPKHKPDNKKKPPVQLVPPEEPKWDYEQDNYLNSSSAASSAPSAAEVHLKDLTAAVKRMEQPLTPDVQSALAAAQKLIVVDPTIQLQSAAAKLGNARDNLLAARRARQNLHNSWAKFLTEAVQRWNQHSEDFETKDAAHVQAIEEALEKYKNAKEIMEESKAAVSASDLVEIVNIDPSEEELMTDVVPTINDDIKSMTQTFDRIRARQAETMEGSAAKKPRTSEGDPPDGAKPPYGSASLQPFARGGK